MKQHLLSSATRLRRGRSASILAASFALATFTFTGHVMAQTSTAGSPADQAQPTTALEQEKAVPGAVVETKISAPAAGAEETSLVSPPGIPFLALEAAQAGGSSSSHDLPSATTGGKAAGTKAKPPHHALGVTLAVVGTATLVVGVTGFALTTATGGFCGTGHGCHQFHDATLGMMPGGLGAAITGFYFMYHR